jgi:hypothetical protein
MKKKSSWLKFKAAVIFSVSVFSTATIAQQTIVNVPSSDVLGKGESYFEFDATFKFDKDPNNSVNKFSSFIPRIVAGAGKNIEVGLNLTGNVQPGSDTTVIMPTIKAKFFDKKGWSIVGGDHIYKVSKRIHG